MKKVVIWLVRDTCRYTDNPSLHYAITRSAELNAYCVSVACLEPRRWIEKQFGLLRTGQLWKNFRVECLLDLRENLRKLNSSLWIQRGEPNAVLQKISESLNILEVVTDLPLSVEERYENDIVRENGFAVTEIQCDDLFSSNFVESALSRTPLSFTKFRRKIEKDFESNLIPMYEIQGVVRTLSQPWPDPSELRNSIPVKNRKPGTSFVGGESSGLLYWQRYLESHAISKYKMTRNFLLGKYSSSHMSLWLSHGCISVRYLVRKILDYESQFGANDSTYWFKLELLWREFFRWYARRDTTKIFDYKKNCSNIDIINCTNFTNWTKGCCGIDIVDAGMRELYLTGWLSNRARQLCASALINELNSDWRWGASWFESCLIDFDPASNWCNWAYISGKEMSPRGRICFDLDYQTKKYDSAGEYRKLWLKDR